MKTRFLPVLSAAVLALLSSAAAHAASEDACTMHLVVALTPDVPNPHDAGFLSSLLNDHPEFRLSWVKQVDASFVALDLNGPGPVDRCEDVVTTMRRDGRVLSVYTEPEDVVSVTAAATDNTPSQEETPSVSVSPYGFGALYWAAQHPARAWQIVLPVSE